MYHARCVRVSVPGSPTPIPVLVATNIRQISLINSSLLRPRQTANLFFTSPSLFPSLPFLVSLLCLRTLAKHPQLPCSFFIHYRSLPILPTTPFLSLNIHICAIQALALTLLRILPCSTIPSPGSLCSLASYIFRNPNRAAPCSLFPPSSTLSCDYPNEQRCRFPTGATLRTTCFFPISRQSRSLDKERNTIQEGTPCGLFMTKVNKHHR
ncbi:hypothetical protein CGRA01v4_03717 [Colletotrichum graminicola]|nr:hypothetical protein CGRA01v4_03717 [Colletotrichum graminicola]